MTTDPIDILELERPFTVDQLEKAFKKRARELHPDHGGTKEQFQELNAAYEQLKKEVLSLEDKVLNAFKQICLQVGSNDILPEVRKKIHYDKNQLIRTINHETFTLKILKNNQKTLPKETPFHDVINKIYEEKIERQEHILTECRKMQEINDELVKLFPQKHQPSTSTPLDTQHFIDFFKRNADA